MNEYSEEYCLVLEAAYGKHMLSEGGTVAADRLFAGMSLAGKRLLDIGSGLGGTAFHLATQHQVMVTGIEINTWLTAEAQRRIPDHLQGKVDFVTYDAPPLLPFADAQFDMVYSKGVLVHVNDRLPLFREIQRVLKPNGCVVIDDWLSPIKNQWGARLQKMCEMEDLTLYAQTEKDYQKVLRDAGFVNVQMRDENKNYAQYNRDIVARLNTAEVKSTFCQRFGETSWQQAVEGYQLITDSIQDQELLIRWFCARKT